MTRRTSGSAVAAAVILLVEGAFAITGWPQQALAACALLIAPGLAVLALLPRELRRLPVAVPVVPIAGFVVTTILLVSLSAVGLALDDVTIRAGLGAVVLAGLIGSRYVDDGRPIAHHRGAFPALLGLAGITGLGVALQALVIGGTPLPGEDWGEYLLYAQEIEREQALLIDNPYWMLGGDWFPLDPGVPAVYGAFLTLADVPATALLHGIWVFAVLAILAVFVLAAALWGATAGLVAAGLYAVAPMTLNMLAWHGLPNVAALSLIPVALFAAGVALRGDETRRHAVVLGCGLVALAAVHRFSFVLGLLAVVVSLAFGLVRRPGSIARFAGWTVLAAAVTGTAVDDRSRPAQLRARGDAGVRGVPPDEGRLGARRARPDVAGRDRRPRRARGGPRRAAVPLRPVPLRPRRPRRLDPGPDLRVDRARPHRATTAPRTSPRSCSPRRWACCRARCRRSSRSPPRRPSSA